MKINNTHTLYTAHDFTKYEFEQKNVLATSVITHGMNICKQCGKRDLELNGTCSNNHKYKLGEIYTFKSRRTGDVFTGKFMKLKYNVRSKFVFSGKIKGKERSCSLPLSNALIGNAIWVDHE